MPHLDHSLVSGLTLFAGLEPAELDDILTESHAVHRRKNTTVDGAILKRALTGLRHIQLGGRAGKKPR